MDKYFIEQIVNSALSEDLGTGGDITSNAILSNEQISFAINAREEMIVCGLVIVEEILNRYKQDIDYYIHKKEGDLVATHTTIISGVAKASVLLSIERVALNFLQHTSGIASLTHEFIKKVSGTKAKIRDTRKTTPGLRLLEKYAVNIGGGSSYRMSLEDQILIKDNHIMSCGGIKIAVDRVRNKWNNKFIAIECDTLLQVEEAISAQVDLILLDNMSLPLIKKAVDFVNGKVILEVSGGVNLENVRGIAEQGVDYIAVGMLTHSAPSKDIGLDTFFIG